MPNCVASVRPLSTLLFAGLGAGRPRPAALQARRRADLVLAPLSSDVDACTTSDVMVHRGGFFLHRENLRISIVAADWRFRDAVVARPKTNCHYATSILMTPCTGSVGRGRLRSG